MTYPKPALTIDEQCELLQARGMVIENLAEAKHALYHINYYRLRAYWLPFEIRSDDSSHQFEQGTRFEEVIRLYTFDRQLRLLLLDATERLEVSFRTTWAYQLAQFAGAHAHLELSLFNDEQKGVLGQIKGEIKRSQETFVKHYRDTYANPEIPPIWATCEVMTFGQLSKSFNNLKDKRLRRTIASSYRLPEAVYGSFLYQASYLRNLCAHHSRVWNRDFTFLFQLPRTKPEGLALNFDSATDARGNPQNRKLYNTLIMLVYLMDIVSAGGGWGQRLNQLLSANRDKTEDMGFPSDWRDRSIWKNLAQ